MRKFFFTLISIICVSLSMHAADTTLCVQLSSGSVDKYMLAKKPKITFSEDGFKISTAEADVEYPSNNVEGFFFENQNSTVDNTKVNSVFQISPAEIRVIGNCQLALYCIDGTLLAKALPVDGCTTISLASLPSGVYIVTAGNQTIKIKH